MRNRQLVFGLLDRRLEDRRLEMEDKQLIKYKD